MIQNPEQWSILRVERNGIPLSWQNSHETSSLLYSYKMAKNIIKTYATTSGTADGLISKDTNSKNNDNTYDDNDKVEITTSGATQLVIYTSY